MAIRTPDECGDTSNVFYFARPNHWLPQAILPPPNFPPRCLTPTAVRLHDNLHVLIQRHQKPQQAFDGELAEVAAQHFRDIGLADSEQIGRFHLLESAFLQDRVNLEYELRLDQVLFGVGHADILEYVAAAGHERSPL